ncbi:hypothetical protein [Nocardia sp. No.11]|uniref:hypothetical protein n=1 Tax=Nocardia sp. No.11 TaxID=3128861 RepID=UPI00319E7B7B
MVGTGDLRQALTAVRVHASADKDDPRYHRVRLQFGYQHLTVSATDRYTGALAIVSLWGDPPPSGYGLAVVELLPEDVAKILAIFKGGKEATGGGASPENLLRLEALGDALRITDCSGMIDGRVLKLPRLAEDSSLIDVVKNVEMMQRSRATAIDDMAVAGELIARFREAAKAYGASLIFQGYGRDALFVQCGDSVLGYCTTRTLAHDRRARSDEWSKDWSYRLPGLLDEARKIAGDRETGEVSDG